MEQQDLNYVENVCWVMLDESKKQRKLPYILILV